MNRRFLLLAVIFSMAIFSSVSATAQTIFVKVWDENNTVLVGSTVQNGYTQQTEITSFGQESSTCAINTPSCTSITGNFIYNFIGDQTITDYRRALYLRRVWRKVEISFTRTNPQGGPALTYEKITLQDVLVTDLTHSATEGGPASFQVKLDPVKISWTFTPTNQQTGAAGTPRTFNWDRSTNSTF